MQKSAFSLKLELVDISMDLIAFFLLFFCVDFIKKSFCFLVQNETQKKQYNDSSTLLCNTVFISYIKYILAHNTIELRKRYFRQFLKKNQIFYTLFFN